MTDKSVDFRIAQERVEEDDGRVGRDLLGLQLLLRVRVRVKVTDPISLTLTRSRSAASALLSAYYSSATTCPRDQGMRRVRGEDGSWRWEIWARYARDMGEMWARYRRDGRQLEVGDGAASPFPPNISPTSPLYLHGIAPLSPLYLPCISPISPLHLVEVGAGRPWREL